MTHENYKSPIYNSTLPSTFIKAGLASLTKLIRNYKITINAKFLCKLKTKLSDRPKYQYYF